jgi:hypothetical protein
MWKKLFSNSGLILLAIILLVFSSSDANAQGRGRSRLMTFEGTLLKYSPHPQILCGDLFIHQVAKYRVDRVLSGKYVSDEIVVDHPACGGNVFENLPVGSRVRITVRIWRGYLHTTTYPGIRDEQTPPKIWYVAEERPSPFTPAKKIVSRKGAKGPQVGGKAQQACHKGAEIA